MTTFHVVAGTPAANSAALLLLHEALVQLEFRHNSALTSSRVTVGGSSSPTGRHDDDMGDVSEIEDQSIKTPIRLHSQEVGTSDALRDNQKGAEQAEVDLIDSSGKLVQSSFQYQQELQTIVQQDKINSIDDHDISTSPTDLSYRVNDLQDFDISLQEVFAEVLPTSLVASEPSTNDLSSMFSSNTHNTTSLTEIETDVQNIGQTFAWRHGRHRRHRLHRSHRR